MVDALTAVPVHELGFDDAVLSFLSLRDHFVLLGKAVKKYIEDASELPDISTTTPEFENALFTTVGRQTDSIRISSVRQKITLIDAHFASLDKAINGPNATP